VRRVVKILFYDLKMAVCQGNFRKVCFEQDDVFVHTAVPASTFYDNIIRGKLQIVEKDDGTFVEWQPLSTLTPEVEYEIHSLLSGPIEYGLVTTLDKKENEEEEIIEKDKSEGYKLGFNVTDIQSIRRSDPRLAWSYAVFVLKDGSTQPALHFHNGGIKQMISSLQRYIWLTRSPVNPKLFLVQEKDGALESTLNQFDVLVEKPTDMLQKIVNNTYYGTLSMFSKVSQNVLGSMGQQHLQERRPQKAVQLGDQDYEMLQADDEPDILGPIIPVARGSQLQPEEWCSYMDIDGKMCNIEQLNEKIFRGGIHHDIKREAWKYLLGFHDFNTTYDERCKSEQKKRELYETIKNQWCSITPEQEARFTEFANKKHLVGKDTHRTDRTLPFFEGDDNENVQKLFNILMTYCMYNFDLGYVQGMSDLLSPILQLVEDEVESFWCFVGLMEKEEEIFEATQHLMKQQLSNLAQLVKYLYPHFATYLEQQHSDNLYFCFRWVIISFKRDFSNNDLMTLWEACWTQNLTPHFKLFICLAILEREKDYMMKNKFDFNDILKHINELANNIELQSVLSRAESLILQLKNSTDLPDHIKELICFPSASQKKEQSKDNINENETDSNHDDNEMTSQSTTNVSQHNSNESTVELNESTQSVF